MHACAYFTMMLSPPPALSHDPQDLYLCPRKTKSRPITVRGGRVRSLHLTAVDWTLRDVTRRSALQQ